MTLKEWAVPGVIIALASGAVSGVSTYAVNSYRVGQTESQVAEIKRLLQDNQRATNDRIDKLWDRIDQMGKGAIETARLQEQIGALANRIDQLQSDQRDAEGKADARYDNLSTRLARQGY